MNTSPETLCSESPDGAHCNHWYDSDLPCCYCGDNTETETS